MAYASASDVSILTPHFLGGNTASTFTSSTSPTLSSVNSWLSSGSALIDAKLATRGYSSIGTTSLVYDFVKQANAFFAAWMAEMSLISARVSKAENTRADKFKDGFEELVNLMMSLDLSQAGVARGKAPPTPYAGGISESDKDAYEDDTDRIVPRFARGMFDNKETQKPDTSRSDEQTRKDG